VAPSPSDTSDKSGGARYAAGWSAIMQLAREGKSWSGHERNAVFLNTGSSRFATASVASGLDFADDGRAIGFTDWDHDGDVDLWFRNRSGPRLRLMLNRSEKSRSIAIRLEGTVSNRDAIGSQVFAETDGKPPQTKSVRAGDLYLSQSSKWLHFGLVGTDTDPVIKVRWPGGREESFGSLRAGGRFLLKEGSGKAKDVHSRRDEVTLPLSDLPASELPATAKILLPARVPLPPCEYLDPEGARQQVTCDSPTLLILWSATCPNCAAELAELSQRSEEIRAAGIKVIALCIDRLTPSEEQPATVPPPPFPWGYITAPSMAVIQHLQTALFDQGIPPTVPLAFLLSAETEVAAIYRGPVGADTLIADVALLGGISSRGLRNLQLPYEGRWFTQPASQSQVLGIVGQRFQSRFPEASLHYLAKMAENETGSRRTALESELGRKHHSLARQFYEARDTGKAEHHYGEALRFAPANAAIHIDFGAMLAGIGRLAEAKKQFEGAIAIDPKNALARKNLELAKALLAK
jgi:hypothetical protein